MGIFLGEKIIQAALISGLTTIKSDVDTYLSKIFQPVDGMASVEIDNLILEVRVKQGYPIGGSRYPGFYVAPATIFPVEAFIGSYIGDGTDDPVSEYSVLMNKNTIRVLTASENADVSLALDTVARYILYSGMENLIVNYALSNFQISVNSFDPVIQYLPENHYYRTSLITFDVLDSWVKNYPVIEDIEAILTAYQEVETV